jgi:hypothetical protein
MSFSGMSDDMAHTVAVWYISEFHELEDTAQWPPRINLSKLFRAPECNYAHRPEICMGKVIRYVVSRFFTACRRVIPPSKCKYCSSSYRTRQLPGPPRHDEELCIWMDFGSSFLLFPSWNPIVLFEIVGHSRIVQNRRTVLRADECMYEGFRGFTVLTVLRADECIYEGLPESHDEQYSGQAVLTHNLRLSILFECIE